LVASCAAWAGAKLAALDEKPAIVRYERERPGELIHLDTKKLGRIEGVDHRITGRRPGAINRHHGIGWEALHVCIDDASRLAYSEIPGLRRGRLCRTRRRKARSAFSIARSAGWPARASPSSGS
jgi:hypothetical protein